MLMKTLIYFRMLYEKEKCDNVLQRIKEYIHGNNSTIIRDLCSGDVPLPSSFLLDELEWNPKLLDAKMKQIIYQLKIISREFYLSMIKFESVSYRKHFNSTSASFRQKITCNLRELQIHHTSSNRWLLLNS